jgi:hypothetical protein
LGIISYHETEVWKGRCEQTDFLTSLLGTYGHNLPTFSIIIRFSFN